MKKVLVVILFLVPFIAQLAMIPLVNKIQPTIFGFPFLHVWLFAWMLLTPIFTLLMHKVLQSKSKKG